MQPIQNLILSQKAYAILLFVLVTSLSFLEISGNALIPIIQLLVASFILSTAIPSEIPAQKFAIAIFLVIGISPTYLILRGIFSKSTLNNFDYASYLTLIITLSLFLNRYKHKTVNGISFYNKKELVGLIYSIFPLCLVVAVQFYLLNLSTGHAVAWIASGDSKNHLMFAVDIVRYGFLDVSTFLTQPINAPTFLALILASQEITGGTTAVLANQMVLYSFNWVLLLGLFGIIVYGLVQILLKRFDFASASPLVGTITAFSGLFSFITGPSTSDGFFTSILGIASIALATSWLIEVFQTSKNSLGKIFITWFLFSASLMSWMFIIFFTFPLALITTRKILLDNGYSRKKIDFNFASLTLSLVALVHYSEFGQTLIRKAKSALNSPGAINVPDTKLLIVISLVLLILSIIFRINDKDISFAFLCISVINLAALFALKKFSNLTITANNYYLLKYQWIVFSGLFLLIISFTVVTFTRYLKNENKFFSLFIAVITFGSFYLISEAITPSNQVWERVFRGWQNPKSEVIDLVFLQEIDNRNPSLFFRTGYAGDATLGNFWMTGFSEPREPLKGWNYTIDPNGDASQMCEVNAYYPEITLITSDLNLEGELNEQCPAEKFNFIYIQPIL